MGALTLILLSVLYARVNQMLLGYKVQYSYFFWYIVECCVRNIYFFCNSRLISMFAIQLRQRVFILLYATGACKGLRVLTSSLLPPSALKSLHGWPFSFELLLFHQIILCFIERNTTLLHKFPKRKEIVWGT